MIVVLCLEEVLSEVGVPLQEAGPTLFGRRIYTTLFNSGESIVMLSTSGSRKMVKEWLLKEGFSDYVKLLVNEDGAPPTDWKVDSVHRLVAQGHHVAYMVDHDPSVLSAVSHLGIPVLLALHATDNPGRMSDHTTYRSWDSLVDTIEAQSLRQAELRRQRMKDEGTGP